MAADENRGPSGNAADAASLEERLRADLAPQLLLVRELGAGGMARVFLAREPALKRLVAVKVLAAELSADAEARTRFEREAQAVAGLSHPNIVTVYRVGELGDGTPYFVMQHVAGESLHARVARAGPLPVADARRVIAEVASALAFAHRQKIIHRDIKPANILYEEAAPRALVADFGIAAVTTPQDVRLTQTGAVVGTPKYMSPEQLLAEKVSEKTDVYSLGLLAHELLTGSSPFTGTTPNELIAAHLRDVPQRVSQRREDVDPELDAVVARCLEKEADKRPTAEEIARRLTPGGPGILEWPAPGLDALMGKTRPAMPVSVLGATLVLVAMSVFTLVLDEETSANVPITMLLMGTCMVGLLLLVHGLRHTVRLAAAMTRARRAGYSWMTVVETAVDHRGDSGTLIAGTGGFAAFSPRQQQSVRVLRVAVELIPLAAGLLALPLLVAALAAGSWGLAGPTVIWLVDGTLAGAVLASLAMSSAEAVLKRNTRDRRSLLLAGAYALFGALMLWLAQADLPELAFIIMAPALAVSAIVWRRKQRKFQTPALKAPALKAPASDPAVADAWYRSLPALSGINAGAGSPRAGRAITLVIELACLLAGMVLTPILVEGVRGWRHYSGFGMEFVLVRNMLLYQEIISEARDLGIAKDARISPLAAGRALLALDAAQAWIGPGRRFAVHQPATLPLPAAVGGEWTMPSTADTARRRLLEMNARAEVWTSFSMIARAPAIDYIGARFVLPFRDDYPLGATFPGSSRYQSSYLMGNNAARAAYHLWRGRADSAEIALREGISFGQALMDNGVSNADFFGGYTATVNARAAIKGYCALRQSNRSSLCRVSARPAGASRNSRSNDAAFAQATVTRDDVRRAATDGAELRVIRLRMLRLLALQPCTNVRDLVFAREADRLADFTAAQKSWARSPADSALLRLVYQRPDLFPLINAPFQRFYFALARFSSWVLRNPRIAQCAITSLG